MKNMVTFDFCRKVGGLKKDLAEINKLVSTFPTSHPDPENLLRSVSNHFRNNGFGYQEKVSSLSDVLSHKKGSCLGLSVLVSTFLLQLGQTPTCKILVRPKDAIDNADGKLFTELTNGDYFAYDHPILPKLADEPTKEEKENRFVPLCHPVIVLGNTSLETTKMHDENENPLLEHPAESVSDHNLTVLISYYLSDKAKNLLEFLAKPGSQTETAEKFREYIQGSLDIFPNNRDALVLKWKFGNRFGQKKIQEEAMEALLALPQSDSDLSYKRWVVTGEVTHLDRTLEQFPAHMPAFLDRKVFLERDPREVKMNLAVAAWCITYSSVLSIQDFFKNRKVREKIKELKFK